MSQLNLRMIRSVALASLLCVAAGCESPIALADRQATPAAETSLNYAWIADFPHHGLRNEHARVWIVLPDPKHGFNQATRFDRAGMVILATTAPGHTYFGPLTDKQTHDPLRDDHVAGTAGEFGITHPPGYDTAAIGEAFLKIGVGKLSRQADAPYFFRATFPVLDPGTWSVHSDAISVTMQHVLHDHGDGWAYRYTTHIELLKDRPGFRIRRELHNTGRRHIQTDHYAHNFVVLDDYPVAVGSRVAWTPTHTTIAPPKLRDAASLTRDALTVTRELEQQPVFVRTASHPDDLGTPWQASVTHPQTEAAVTILQTPRPDRLVLYVDRQAMSVEPFIDIDALPGHAQSWTTTYALR